MGTLMGLCGQGLPRGQCKSQSYKTRPAIQFSTPTAHKTSLPVPLSQDLALHASFHLSSQFPAVRATILIPNHTLTMKRWKPREGK